MATAKGGPLSRIILDEIALEGLEGITIPSLFVFVSSALELQLPLVEKLQIDVWSFVLRNQHHLSFFELPEERPIYQIYNRFENLDPHFGVPINPDVCPYNHYKCVPIQDGYIVGSCESYKERLPIDTKQLQELSLAQVLERWGNKLVIVASQDLRYNVLTPDNVVVPKDLTPLQYCFWETIGRSRYNGETTAGAWSLQRMCKDSTIVFYIKNKLIRLGIIAHQPFTEKRVCLLGSTLLTLPRFHTTHKSLFNAVIEELVIALKAAPTHRMTFLAAREFFTSSETRKSFKKIAMTHFFRRIFNVVNIPATEASDVYQLSEKSKKDRTVHVVELKDPNITVEQLYAENNDESCEKDVDFFSEKHSFVDMPVLEEFYRGVARHGSRGCSQSEICNYLGMQHLTVRQIVRKALSSGMITSYYADFGRQRTNMFVSTQYSAGVKQTQDETQAALNSLQCADEPTLPQDPDFALQDIPSITARIRPHEYESKNVRRETTLRHIERQALVVKHINEMGIVQVIDLRHSMQNAERENGYTDEICQKSVRRLLAKLTQRGVIQVYEIMLQCEEHIRLYRYVTHPKIDAEHEVLHREVLKHKNSFYISLEERQVRALQQLQSTRRIKSATAMTALKERKDLLPLSAYKSPKFLIARFLHEFFFYIRYVLDEYHKPLPITRELLLHWQQAEPNIVIDDYMSTLQDESGGGCSIVAYTDEISWRTFIPPLPKYEEKTAGWMLLMDAVDRMPLSIFNKIVRLEKCVDQRVSEYLTHPVRQHYLIKQLPCDLQCQISRVRLQNIYSNAIKILNNMGLVQIAPRVQKDPLQMWFYQNQHAQVLDTTTTEASYYKINPDRSYGTINYVFRTFDDVLHYWTSLHRICVHTKLGFRKVSQRRQPGKNPEILFLEPVSFAEAAQNDLAPHVPGDRLGAAGLSTHLYAHALRNWSWIVHAECKPKATRTGRIAQPARTKIPKILIQHRKSASAKAGGRLSVIPLKRLQVKTAAKPRSSGTSVTKKSSIRDAIDRDALKNMRTLRVSWRKEEDGILLMARAVYLYVSAPVIIFNLVNISKICRDVLRHHLGSYNKTSQACLRRGQFIVKMNRHLPEVPSWLHMLQTSPQMQTQYGDCFVQNLKKAYPNRAELIHALTVHFVLILSFLYRQINSNETIDRPHFLIPDTVAEFKQRFKECIPVQDDRTVHYCNPESEFDLQVTIVISVLHSSLCCTRDKTLYNMQAFEIYKHFGEDVLHVAFKKARSDGLVVAIKRKNMHVVPSQVAGPAYVFSQKYRFRLTFLKIPYSVYDIFYAYYVGALKRVFGASTLHNAKQCIELKSPNVGHLFFIGEGLTSRQWMVDVQLPSNILTVDAEQRQTISPMDRILDHYHSIFDNAPETEYIKQFETEPSERQVRIKFHPANLSYKVHYSPYDFISKLPTRHLHFFCALDHLQQEVDINFSKLQHKDDEHNVLVMECPFSCVLKHSNYISAIERIVQEKKLVLRELQEMPPQKLLSMATTSCTLTVQPNNLLTLVRMLESFWREKDLLLDRKDLGKVSNTLKINKTIDWHQLCRQILEYNSAEDDAEQHDEYEPILNKEERIVRAQDVFVVNLPTMQLSVSNEMNDCADTMQHEGVAVPKQLLHASIQREEILQKILKESYWKYTDNTLETLQPILRERKFSSMELQHLEEIHNYILQHKLGVSVTDLMREFPYDKFLSNALHTLSDHCLIKRVGVSKFMYVHKAHIRPWVVHTFHIKRLERENLGSTSNVVATKRTHLETVELLGDDEDLPTGVVKKAKATNAADEVVDVDMGRRIPKPIQRYASASTVIAGRNEVAKDLIVMKPQPWIRLNGSLNRRALDKWLGSILIECIARSGCIMHEIFVRFHHMLPADIMFLLEILCDLKCVRLRQIHAFAATLFSEYESIKETDVTELYNPEDTYVIAQPDALTKLAVFIGNKKYNTEFI